MRAFEIATEMFFVYDGTAEIIEPYNKEIIGTLKEHDYFGEMGIITGKSGIRAVLSFHSKVHTCRYP